MFQNWTIKQIIARFGFILLILLSVQLYLLFSNFSIMVHFAISFLALFVALIMFHSINIKIKQSRRKK